MTRFSLRYPYFIIVLCLVTCVVGVTQLVRMPVDLFPNINIPVVVVATFFNGMPPEEIETDITGRFERFFTLGSGIDHMESRSLTGVSLVKVYFQPGTNPDSAVSQIANLAGAQLRQLPPGTLPPVVLKFDASSLPVCLITLKGEGLNETRLRDEGQYDVRNQVAGVPGASVPQPFGGRFRTIMVYVDPLKLEANQLSVMDVVRTVNDSNLILPAGDVKVGTTDYDIYANSQLPDMKAINNLPLKTVGNASVLVADVGIAKDASGIQTNIVHIDGQPSVYLPVLKQGGDTNTIAVVEGIRQRLEHLVDIPKQLITKVVFDQSVFVKTAIENLIHEGALGLILTGLMIMLFLANLRATVAVFLSIPLSALATFIVLSMGGGTINTMVLGGLALVFSRLIDNSVVVLENIFRHLENGETPGRAAELGGSEVGLPVLSATFTAAVVFFPVTFLYGVSQFLFGALALAVVIALFASYLVAMSVVPLYCARFLSALAPGHHEGAGTRPGGGFFAWFNRQFAALVSLYDRSLGWTLGRPGAAVAGILALSALCFLLSPLVGLSYFPRTDPGQFVINVKAPTGTRIEETDRLIKGVEKVIREEVPEDERDVLLANIGVTPDFSAMYTSNSGPHTAFVQCSLKQGHRVSSFTYMDRIRSRLTKEMPELATYFQTGGLVDAVLNLGLPAPIDIQVEGTNLEADHKLVAALAREVRNVPGVEDVLVPQDIDYPSINLDIDRERASKLGLSSREVVGNVITALTSDAMIAPSYWIDRRTGNDYMLTVQYPENQIVNLDDFKAIPLRSSTHPEPTRLDAVGTLSFHQAPTEVDHYQLRRVMDAYVAPAGEDLSRVSARIRAIIAKTTIPAGVRVHLRGMVQGMNSSFTSFGYGLCLSVILVYLILVAQFRSFIDPFLILLAVPPGLAGVVLILSGTGTTLNVMSLMGVVMMVGIVVSNSILILEFAHRLRNEGRTAMESAREACRVRLRPILMTSLATLIGLIPMVFKLGTGTEAYSPLARAIVGGLTVSVVLTMYIVPAAYLLIYRRQDGTTPIAHADQVPP